MATKIRATPILTGKDAEEFYKRLKENENKKISSEELKKIRDNAEWVKSILRKSIL